MTLPSSVAGLLVDGHGYVHYYFTLVTVLLAGTVLLGIVAEPAHSCSAQVYRITGRCCSVCCSRKCNAAIEDWQSSAAADHAKPLFGYVDNPAPPHYQRHCLMHALLPGGVSLLHVPSVLVSDSCQLHQHHIIYSRACWRGCRQAAATQR